VQAAAAALEGLTLRSRIVMILAGASMMLTLIRKHRIQGRGGEEL
jgi:hypothetical protein